MSVTKGRSRNWIRWAYECVCKRMGGTKRDERSKVRGVSVRSENGAWSRKGWAAWSVVKGLEASNK